MEKSGKRIYVRVLGEGKNIAIGKITWGKICLEIRRARVYVVVVGARGLKMEPEDSYGERLEGKSYVQVYMWECVVVKNENSREGIHEG